MSGATGGGAPAGAGDPDAAGRARPAGDGNHVVRQGESIESIALAAGWLPASLWDHPANAALKEARRDPTLLLPGDRVAVPAPRPKQAAGAAGSRHSFRRKGLPSQLRVVVKREGRPRANEPYVLNVDGRLSRGSTDGDGAIEVRVRPDAVLAKLVVGRDEADQQSFDLLVSSLDPVASVTGAQQRLNNLGYPCPVSGELDVDTQRALADFQCANDLEATGEPDSRTQDALAKAHGG